MNTFRIIKFQNFSNQFFYKDSKNDFIIFENLFGKYLFKQFPGEYFIISKTDFPKYLK